MAGVQGHQVTALVGYGVAQRVDDRRFVPGIGAAGQQLHRLHHVGVSADNDIHTHIAHFLGDHPLGGIRLKGILRAPVNVQHGGLRTVFLHLGQKRLYLGIEGVQIVVGKVIHQINLRDLRLIVEGGTAIDRAGGVGVGRHAHLDAAHVHHGVLGFLVAELGPQRGQTHFPHPLHRAQDAFSGGVGAVIVGSEQHVDPRVLRRLHDPVGAVELGVALIHVIVAAQGGFQIGDGVVVPGSIFCHVAENRFKIVAAILCGAGGDHGLVHQQVALDAHGGGGDRLHGLGLHRRWRTFLGLFPAYGFDNENHRDDCRQHQRQQLQRGIPAGFLFCVFRFMCHGVPPERHRSGNVRYGRPVLRAGTRGAPAG